MLAPLCEAVVTGVAEVGPGCGAYSAGVPIDADPSRGADRCRSFPARRLRTDVGGRVAPGDAGATSGRGADERRSSRRGGCGGCRRFPPRRSRQMPAAPYEAVAVAEVGPRCGAHPAGVRTDAHPSLRGGCDGRWRKSGLDVGSTRPGCGPMPILRCEAIADGRRREGGGPGCGSPPAEQCDGFWRFPREAGAGGCRWRDGVTSGMRDGRTSGWRDAAFGVGWCDRGGEVYGMAGVGWVAGWVGAGCGRRGRRLR